MPQDIRSEIVIDAPRARVWSVLRDVERYPEWNPFTPRVETTLAVGTPIILHVAMRPAKPTMRQPEVVSSYVEGEELGWGMSMRPAFLLKANRTQRLVELSPSSCRYVSVDTFSGVLVPLVMALYGAAVQRGFDETARALKERAERGP